MHRTPSNPFRHLLDPADRDVLDRIRLTSITRYGYDAFRMEGPGGDGGGDGGDGGGSGDGDGDGGDGSGDGQGDDSKKTAGDDGKKGSDSDSPWDDPVKAKAEIERLRRENAADRTTAKSKAAEDAVNDLTQKLGKALGLIKDGDKDKVDPAELAKQVETATTRARQTAVELAVYRGASKHSGDPDALLDSRAFLAKVSDLDPDDDKFASKVDTAIKDAVKDNPKLKAGQAPGSSSADHGAGGSGEKGTRKPKSLADAVASTYGT
jgi:hypothetical protein